MPVAVETIRPRLGDDVEHDAAGLAILSIVAVREHLELFHFFDRCTKRVATGNNLIRDGAAIDIDLYSTVVYGSRTDQVAGNGGEIILDSRRYRRETGVIVGDAADAVEACGSREGRNLLAVNDVRNVGLSRFHQHVTCGYVHSRGGS